MELVGYLEHVLSGVHARRNADAYSHAELRTERRCGVYWLQQRDSGMQRGHAMPYGLCLLIELELIDVAIHCTWNEWSEWTPCTLACGGGEMNRTRTQNAAQYGGLACTGESLQIEPCNTAACCMH